MARTLKNSPLGKLPKLRIPRLPEVTDEPDVFEEMTLQEHLEEFRDRILKVVIAIIPTFIFGFWFAKYVVLPDIAKKANTIDGLDIKSPTEVITLNFKVALYVAIAICMPIIVYQLVAFLAPGMTKKEKRILFTALPFVSILFITGALYGYFIAAPKALNFLSNWLTAIDWNPDGNETVSFFLTLTVGLGLSFQLPVIMFIVAKLGIFTPKQMRKARKYAFIAILIASAIVTPSTDPYNMAIVAGPLYVLYEFGIIISSIFAKTGTRSTSSDSGKKEIEAVEANDV